MRDTESANKLALGPRILTAEEYALLQKQFKFGGISRSRIASFRI